MSKPREHKDNIHGAILEIISGVSSLNMKPQPIEPPEGSMGFLSESDGNAKHAIGHLEQAVKMLNNLTREEKNTMQITLNVRNVGTLPGTSKWLVEELRKRNACLDLNQTRAGNPAVFLEYDVEEQGAIRRKNLCLAAFALYDRPEINKKPFPDDWSDRAETFCGVSLSAGATNILYALADKAKELLEAKMQEEDATVDPKSIDVAVA